MKTVLLLAICLVICGCATVGNPMKAEQLTQLQDGVTTQAEVLKIMGEASDKTIIDTGEEKWTYIYTRATPTWGFFVPIVGMFESGATAKGQKLEILFNTNKIVKKHAVSNPKTTIKTGIFQ